MNDMITAANSANLPLTYLGYSLLTILTIATALVKVYLQWRKARFTQGDRMLLGLLALLIVRIAVFSVTYATWQAGPIMPPGAAVVDQASFLIGAVLIAWLWNFPERNRLIDLAVLALCLGAALLAVFPLSSTTLVEGFLISMAFWQGLSIFLLIISIGLILIRLPNKWLYGLFMLGILLIGSFLAVLRGSLESLHLSQLAAYPLLLILGDRFLPGKTTRLDEPEDEEPGRRHFSVDHQILAIIQQLFDPKDPTGILYKIARASAYLILADLTMIIDTPDQHGKIRIIAGYDLIREEPLQAITLDSKSIPLISNYIERGKMLHIPASSTSRDLSHLSKMLQLSKPGHLLASPIFVPGANKTIGMILFSPFSNRPWTKEDQDYVRLLCDLVKEAFSHHLISQDGESEGVKNTIRDLSSKLTQLTQDKQQLREDMAVLSREHQNLLLDQSNLQNKYTQLLGWGNALQRHLAMLVDLSKKESIEALRKYIAVVEKEIGQPREDVDFQEPTPETISEADKIIQSTAEDPDSARPANLIEAVEACLNEIQAELDEKDLKASLDLPEDPPLLKMNHALFSEILSFLVTNAVLENKPGGEINIRTQIYEEDDVQRFAHIKIADQGEGYYPDEIAGILNDHLTSEQQEQLSQVMTNLYVTKNLVENEGGRMWVESSPGTGTTVSLLLAFL